MASPQEPPHQVIELLAEPPASGALRDGYLDLLGSGRSGSSSLGQRLMTSRGLPMIYERLWRPVGVRFLTGARGLGGAMERRMTDELLALEPGDAVLDVACGPGNISRSLRAAIGERGGVVGIDASATMLARAVRDTAPGGVAYVRADAERLPFRDASFDAVCCYAALYLMDDPFAAIGEMVRVLAPGGRIAVLTSCHRGPGALHLLASVLTGPGGIRMFGRDEVTGALAAAGLTDVRQSVTGFAQFVGARKIAHTPVRD